MRDEPYVESYFGRMPMSASQEIDRFVTLTERPYGYDGTLCPADEENKVSVEQMRGSKFSGTKPKRGY